MFKIEKIVAVFIICFLLFGEVGSYLSYKEYSLFYQKPEFDEINHGLFSKLDPILGYSHNTKYKFTERDFHLGVFKDTNKLNLSIPGFVILEYKIDNNPLHIVVLGDSLSDPFMFGGNWPWQLHLQLTEKNISHVIYNGAVSGYTSYQSLNKLIRDVFQLQNIDLVIAYNGFNDFPTTGDIVPDYPAIHSFQKSLFERLSGKVTFEVTPSFLPNLQYLTKRLYAGIVNSSASEISYGLAPASLELNFRNNTIFMEKLTAEKKIKFYHFIPPLMTDLSQLDDETYFENTQYRKPEYIERLRNDITRAATAVKDLNYSHSLIDKAPKDQKFFIDPGHINTKGSFFVANEIYEIISKDFNAVRK